MRQISEREILFIIGSQLFLSPPWHAVANFHYDTKVNSAAPLASARKSGRITSLF